MIRFLIPILLMIIIVPAGCAQSGSTEADTQQAVTKVSILELEDLRTEHPDLILVDVRTPSEIAQGKIEGAREVDYRADDFRERIQELPRDTGIALYCRTGNRSAGAADIMRELGFTQLFVLEGGYTEWSKKH
jgi:phage shock protein E